MRSPIPIVDCHGHLGVRPDFPSYKTEPAEMLRVMDLLNIERLAITSTLACYNDCPRGNAEIEEVVQQFPSRFIGYVTVNPSPAGEALQQLQLYRHFHTPPLIKLHPACHQYPVNGSKYLPIWDYANQTRAAVLVHTWDSDLNCSPLLLQSIGQAFKNVRIIVGHSGVTWRGYEQALDVAGDSPNAFLDITGSQSHRTIIEHCVQRIGAERVLFGSDLPFLDAAVSLGRVLTARIADCDKELILRTNFLRILADSGL
jgi:uncharacterized protein